MRRSLKSRNAIEIKLTRTARTADLNAPRPGLKDQETRMERSVPLLSLGPSNEFWCAAARMNGKSKAKKIEHPTDDGNTPMAATNQS